MNNKFQNKKTDKVRMGPISFSSDKPKNFKETIKKLGSYLKHYRLSIIIVILFAFGSTAFSIVGPKLLGDATTKIFEGLMSKISNINNGIDFTYIGKILIILTILYIISAIFSFIQGLIMANISQKITYSIRRDISLKINKIPLKYYDKQTYGDILSRVTNDVDTLGQTLSQSLSETISSITLIIGVIIMMLSISVKMTLIALIVIPISILLLMFIVKKSQKYFKDNQEYLGDVNGYIEEMYGAHNIVKSFNKETKSLSDFNEINDKLYNANWKANFFSGMMMPTMNFIGNLGYVIISIMGGWYVIQKEIKVGDVLAFIQYVRLYMQPLRQGASITTSLQGAVAAAERIFEFLEENNEVKDKDKAITLDKVKGEVIFKNVSFGYDEKTIINNFNIEIKPGQKVAIVGPTGAGKTTIVKLLMRFYDVNNGSILIDNHDIRDLKRDNLRSIIGMVLQDTWLFNGTIMDNIRYGNLNATDEEVMKAASAAHVDHFIHTIPDGYNHTINEETDNISQGEKQLLTIARAFLANPKILILDEATSSVDTRTEVLIQKAMEKLMNNRTSFIIAHRLSTIKNADIILVLNNGDIVEQGNHEELLEKNGFYASLYKSQFED